MPKRQRKQLSIWPGNSRFHTLVNDDLIMLKKAPLFVQASQNGYSSRR